MKNRIVIVFISFVLISCSYSTSKDIIKTQSPSKNIEVSFQEL
jgi:hypothetical protein